MSRAKTRPSLPPLQDAFDFTLCPLPEPPALVHGFLHKGCKVAVGGGSKTQKTWLLMDLALSVSHNEPWLSMKTHRTDQDQESKVAYVNLELPEWSFQKRIIAIAEEKQIKLTAGRLLVWNLRGHSSAYASFIHEITESLRQQSLSLIIIDPIYKLYGNADENSARDISGLLNEFERLAQDTGAAIAFAAHFSKGNQAAKESIDRMSGSGVFARDPDTIMTLTRHETEGAFTVDTTLRNHAPIQPFVVKWLYPLMRRTDDLDPAKIKQPHKGGSVKSFTAEMIIDCLGKRKLSTSAFQKRCADESGITRATFYRLLGEATKAKKIIKNSDEEYEVSTGINDPV